MQHQLFAPGRGVKYSASMSMFVRLTVRSHNFDLIEN